jgi:cytochrome c peroxidase
MQYAHLIAADGRYRAAYEPLFGPLPDLSNRNRFPASAGPVDNPQARAAWEAMAPQDRAAVTRVYANMGKAIAAYERLLSPGPGSFDAYVQALLAGDRATMRTSLTTAEVAGLRLFGGKANCILCHNGPRFTNNEFHNTGVPTADGLVVDHGRMVGIEEARADLFNCLGAYSDSDPNHCGELRFARRGQDLDGAFKTPTLRNVAETGPYMHAGQFVTLREVLDHYNRAPMALVGRSELQPLQLTETELQRLEAFLLTLTAPLMAAPKWLAPPER